MMKFRTGVTYQYKMQPGGWYRVSAFHYAPPAPPQRVPCTGDDCILCREVALILRGQREFALILRGQRWWRRLYRMLRSRLT